MLRHRILVTGNPGIGKTTCLLKVIKALKIEAIGIDGFYSQEVKFEGRRVGFKIIGILNGEWGWLAKVDNGHEGAKIGRYRVIKKDLERIGLTSLKRAAIGTNIQVVAVDEIGPMELLSKQFNEMVERILNLDKIFLATVHKKSVDAFSLKAQRNGEVALFYLSLDNRDEVPKKITDLIKEALSSRF